MPEYTFEVWIACSRSGRLDAEGSRAAEAVSLTLKNLVQLHFLCPAACDAALRKAVGLTPKIACAACVYINIVLK
ncbi:hypothetical protein NDU88_001898 [Pleurodeles waltl]|uniref:Uncharacterized protein n=1 Tax=Pleurodeles waltl TaxID=8319 RepID=A0AAV7VXQ5_PLEWA|nr:hypothetical protein NDU88_001898 [Pleurodeles waltl]